MDRLFKPGDKVQLKTGGPLMEVAGYLVNDYFSHPQRASSNYVECYYYDPFRGEWKQSEFHEESLRKAEASLPAWMENIKSVFTARLPVLLN